MASSDRHLEPRRPARPISPDVRRRALMIAIGADILQLGLLPLFGAGWLAPLNDVLDVVIAILLVHRLGWHMAFLPTFVAELLPIIDIFPSWTLAVLFVTRHHTRPEPDAGSPAGSREPSKL